MAVGGEPTPNPTQSGIAVGANGCSPLPSIDCIARLSKIGLVLGADLHDSSGMPIVVALTKSKLEVHG